MSMESIILRREMLSDNGWTCITSVDSKLLRSWLIGPVSLTLRAGPPGFVLAHLAQFFHEEIERLWPDDMPDFDDHGWGQRFIGGGTSGVPSNHWSAVAMDLNAKRHPQGVPTLETYTVTQAKRIRTKLVDKYPGIIWGGDWNAVDSMHFELDDISRFPKTAVRDLALQLVSTPIGKRVIAAQPMPVIWQKW